MATLDPKVCSCCKEGKKMRPLKERTDKKHKVVWACEDCDGRLKLFTRFDDDLPRK